MIYKYGNKWLIDWIENKINKSLDINNKFNLIMFIIITIFLISFILINIYISSILVLELDDYIEVHNYFYKFKK